MAERGGFEPPVGKKSYVRLAIWCFKPLSHLSDGGLANVLRRTAQVQSFAQLKVNLSLVGLHLTTHDTGTAIDMDGLAGDHARVWPKKE